MKSTILTTLLGLIIFSSFTSTDPVVENKSVDNQKSMVEWKAYKMGGRHYGTVNIKEGSVELSDGVLTGGQFTMDMTSILVTDITGGGKTSLEEHLKSDHFFNIEEFNTADLKITAVDFKGNGRYEIVADITIKEITQTVNFEATGYSQKGKFSAAATIKLDRSKFNVRYGSSSFFDNLGDKVIYDDFDIMVNIVTL